MSHRTSAPAGRLAQRVLVHAGSKEMPTLTLFDLPILGPDARIEAHGDPEAVQALHRAQTWARDQMVCPALAAGS